MSMFQLVGCGNNSCMPSGDFCLYGVMGNPVSHSLSPVIHNTWLRHYGINAVYQYVPVLSADSVEEVLVVLPKMGYGGVNVTAPFKEVVYDCCHKASGGVLDSSAVVSAYNTVIFGDGGFRCANTDIEGFAGSIERKFGQDGLNGKRFFIIGAGGAAKGVGIAIKRFNPSELYVYNRTTSKTEELIKGWERAFAVEDIGSFDFSGVDVIVNTTSLGLHDEVIDLNYDSISKQHVVVDIVYRKPARGGPESVWIGDAFSGYEGCVITPFLGMASKRGAAIQDGFDMLVGQATKSFEMWTGVFPDSALIDRKVLL